MTNKIFVVGNGKARDTISIGHLFGGLMDGTGNSDVISYGVDFGGDFKKVNLEGKVGEVFTRDLILVPISEASAARCEDILWNLNQLNEAGRWPFAFQSFPDIYERDFQTEFLPYEDQDADTPRKKADANCVTFFNWMARVSGIDLEPLHEKWRYATRGGHINKICDEIYESQADVSREHSSPFRYVVFDLELPGGHSARMIRMTNEEERVRACDLVSVATYHTGGYDDLTAYMDTLKPFEMEPKELDPYLEAEFEALEL